MPGTVYYCASSLDGFIADADDGLDWLLGYEGGFEHPTAEPAPMSPGGAYERFYDGVGALVSGSATYEWILDHLEGAAAGAWPYRDKPYWVLSSRELRLPGGEGADVRVADASPAELFTEMTAAAGERTLWVVGGGDVASQFVDAGLLDEVHVTVLPVVLGTGKPLFARRLAGDPMRLTGTTAFDNGMVELRYEIRR